MRAVTVTILGMFCWAASPVRAEVVTFDFNSLPFFARDAGISEYMTGVYGSPVTTDGARSTRERTDDATNTFISTSLQLLNRGDFEILFGEVPIIGAEFEGHIIDATAGDDFTFLALFDNDLIFELSRDEGLEIFDSGWIDFAEPVNRLIISDSGRKDVGIDDLSVMPVPEPATALLLLIGGGFAARRRKR